MAITVTYDMTPPPPPPTPEEARREAAAAAPQGPQGGAGDAPRGE